MVERCPDKTEAVSSILTTRTGLLWPFTFFMKDENQITKPWWRDGVIIFIKVSGYIAFPIILASFLGKFLDKKYNSNPLFFLISIAIAFCLTIFLIWKEMKIYKKKIDRKEI